MKAGMVPGAVLLLVGCGTGDMNALRSYGGESASPPATESTVVLSGGCGATLVSESLAVTAAHCVPVIRARLGEGRPDSEGIRRLEEDFRIRFTATPHLGGAPERRVVSYRLHSRFFVEYHPSLDHRRALYDLALVKFEGGIPSGFRPARTSPGTETAGPLGFAGFGPASPDAALLRPLQALRVSSVAWELNAVEAELMAVQGGICSGDSGSPIYGRGNVLLGVVSRVLVDGSATLGASGWCGERFVATRVATLNAWLDESRAILSGSRPASRQCRLDDDWARTCFEYGDADTVRVSLERSLGLACAAECRKLFRNRALWSAYGLDRT